MFAAQLGPKGAQEYELVTTTGDKALGMMYVVAWIAFFFLGGLVVLFIHTELALLGLQFVSDEQCNQLFTMLGTVMLLLYTTPVVFGFANPVLRDTRGRGAIAEDHQPERGLDAAVLEAVGLAQSDPLRLAHPTVRIMPSSRTPDQRLAAAAVDAASVDGAARQLLGDNKKQPQRHCASTSVPTTQRRSTARS